MIFTSSKPKLSFEELVRFVMIMVGKVDGKKQVGIDYLIIGSKIL